MVIVCTFHKMTDNFKTVVGIGTWVKFGIRGHMDTYIGHLWPCSVHGHFIDWSQNGLPHQKGLPIGWNEMEFELETVVHICGYMWPYSVQCHFGVVLNWPQNVLQLENIWSQHKEEKKWYFVTLVMHIWDNSDIIAGQCHFGVTQCICLKLMWESISIKCVIYYTYRCHQTEHQGPWTSCVGGDLPTDLGRNDSI